KVAGAIPADNSDPETTVIPLPASCTDPCSPPCEANNSPTGTGPWATAGRQRKAGAAQAASLVFFFWMLALVLDRVVTPRSQSHTCRWPPQRPAPAPTCPRAAPFPCNARESDRTM